MEKRKKCFGIVSSADLRRRRFHTYGFGATPNVLSPRISENLSLRREGTEMVIIAVTGENSNVEGTL